MSSLLKRSFGLDLVRAIAILLVVFSHFVHKYEFVGMFGVEMFFALSGYLIGGIMWRSFTEREWLSFNVLLNFYKRRWYRTLPNYYLFLLLMIPFHTFLLDVKFDYKQLFEFLYFGQGLLQIPPPFYVVAWSLCIEEWFYLLFPLTIYALTALKINIKTSFFSTVLIFVLFSFAIKFTLQSNGILAVREITFARLDAIGLGVFTALLKINFKKIPHFIIFVVGILILLGCMIFFFRVGTYEQFKNNIFILFFLPFGFALLLPLLENYNLKINTNKIIDTVITNLSLWSYSIYLSHIPVIFTVYYILEDYRDSSIVNAFSKVLALFITLFFSKLLFKYFEIPITQKRPKEL